MLGETVRFYPYRDGTNLEPVIETFNNPPKFTLSNEQRERVLGFEKTLTVSADLNRDLGQLTQDEDVIGLGHIYPKRVNDSILFLDYFTDRFRRLGIDIDGIAKNMVLGADYSEVSSEAASKLERESSEFVQARTVDAFEKGGFESVDGIPNPTRLVIIRNPKQLVEKVGDLRKLKRYIKAAENTLPKDEDDHESAAKRLMLTIHRRRANELIAEAYPDARSFAVQVHESASDEDIAMLAQLNDSMRQLLTRGSTSQRIAARFDKFANGAGEMVNGNYIQLSSEAIELAKRVTDGHGEEATDDYEYKDIGKERLKDVKLSPEKLKAFMERYLGNFDILSASDEYDPDRKEPAVDKKWQVVIHPKNTSFSVDPQQKAVKIPPKFNRGVADISPAGGVPVMDHESVHVIQAENRAKVGLAITEEVKMDRGGTLAEGGGVRVEVATQKNLFGQVRPTNPEYLRAAQAILSGGAYVDAFKAFFDSSMGRNPDQDKRKVAELAADRVLRLFRNGGDPASNEQFLSNSGPLEYLEQDLIAERVNGTVLEKAFYYSGVNLQLLAELHKFGMVDFDNTWVPPVPSEVLKEDIDQLIRV